MARNVKSQVPSEADFKPRLFLCLGELEHRVVYIHPYDSEQAFTAPINLRYYLESESTHGYTLRGRARIRNVAGGIYEIPSTDNYGHVMFGKAEFKGMHPDESLVAEIQAYEFSQRRARAVSKAEAEKAQHWLRYLGPVRGAYRRASPIGRSALLLEVIRYIRGE